MRRLNTTTPHETTAHFITVRQFQDSLNQHGFAPINEWFASIEEIEHGRGCVNEKPRTIDGDVAGHGPRGDRRREVTLIAGVLLFVVLGCQHGLQIVPVTGQVTYNGQPLKFGSVTFQPPSGQPARGEIQSDGTFTLSTNQQGDGAVVGLNRVRVACYESQGNPTMVQGGEQSLGKLLIPVNYTLFDQSGLTAEVKAEGNQSFVFELRGPPMPAR